MFNRASILVRYGLFVVGLTVCAASVATAATSLMSSACSSAGSPVLFRGRVNLY